MINALKVGILMAFSGFQMSIDRIMYILTTFTVHIHSPRLLNSSYLFHFSVKSRPIETFFPRWFGPQDSVCTQFRLQQSLENALESRNDDFDS